MFSVHPSVRLVFPLLILMTCNVQASAQSPGVASLSPQTDVSTLIDKLHDIAEGDSGYSASSSATGFLPMGLSGPAAGILGQMQSTSSTTMRELVERGAGAIPDLIAHLNDQRTTKLTFKHGFAFGGMFFQDVYDFNQRTTKQPPTGVNREIGLPRLASSSHTITVGDLCFVALGQIVNRDFNAARYQMSSCIMINSPTYSTALRAAILKEWGSLTPEQQRASLVQDLLQPDSVARRIGACLRLGYYYREILDPLVIKELAAPMYDAAAVESLLDERFYRTEDAGKRKAAFDAFVAAHGEVARQGILLNLFENLRMQEADETGQSPPQIPRHRAREYLVQLFGYPQRVKSEDAPHILPIAIGEQSLFIDTLEYFPDPELDHAVRLVLRTTDDNDLATACINYLIGRGADADIRQYVAQRCRGANANRLAELHALLDRLGWTPLHLAVEKDQVERATRLIREGADVNAQAANGQTPLHVAAAQGDSGAVRVLLEWDAAPNVRDSQGRTPMRLATLAGDAATVEALVGGGDQPNDVLAASLAERADLVEHCLAKNPGAVDTRTMTGETPLHCAARLGYIEVARLLLAHGADVNARDKDKSTPLHEAANYSRSKMVELLLQHKADQHARNQDGQTARDLACERNDKASMRLLKP